MAPSCILSFQVLGWPSQRKVKEIVELEKAIDSSDTRELKMTEGERLCDERALPEQILEKAKRLIERYGNETILRVREESGKASVSTFSSDKDMQLIKTCNACLNQSGGIILSLIKCYN